MLDNLSIDRRVTNNFTNVKFWLLIPPFFLLTIFFLRFFFFGAPNFINDYVESQKGLFYFFNNIESHYPNFEINITQLGDALVIFPLIFVFLFYCPKFWQVLLTSSLITLLISAMLKRIFAVPRPAAILDADSFVIIGRTLNGHTSLPSGHSITAFMVITILLYSLMPKKISHKIVWSILLITVGFIIAFSRVGVGAHYPLDVIIGSCIGYMAAIIGIIVNNNMNWLVWIKNKRFYPVFMFLLLIWVFLVVKKIAELNLFIYYFSFLSLVVTMFLIAKAYATKN